MKNIVKKKIRIFVKYFDGCNKFNFKLNMIITYGSIYIKYLFFKFTLYKFINFILFIHKIKII